MLRIFSFLYRAQVKAHYDPCHAFLYILSGILLVTSVMHFLPALPVRHCAFAHYLMHANIHKPSDNREDAKDDSGSATELARIVTETNEPQMSIFKFYFFL